MNNLLDYSILVGKCGRSIGLKGNIKINIYTDFLDIFSIGNVFKCGDFLVTVEHFNKIQNSIKFIEICDIDAAKNLNSSMLYATKEMTLEYCKLNNDEFFWFDVIGLKLYEKDLLLGYVSDIERIGNIDYLIIQTNSELFKKPKSFMIPYISRYIIKTDLESKCIYTKDTIGILEES